MTIYLKLDEKDRSWLSPTPAGSSSKTKKKLPCEGRHVFVYTDNGSENHFWAVILLLRQSGGFYDDVTETARPTDAVLEKNRQRILSINESLLEGQKEIDDMHEYYWHNTPRWMSTAMKILTTSRPFSIRSTQTRNTTILKHRFRKMLDSPLRAGGFLL